MKVGETRETHMDGPHEVGKEMLLFEGWVRVIAVNPGRFSNCKLYTLEKVRDAKPSDYKPVPKSTETCSRCGSTSHRWDLGGVITCNGCGHWC